MIETISLDVDGVLRDLITGLIITYKKHFPNAKIIQPINSFSLNDYFPECPNIKKFYLEHANEVFFQYSPIIKDSDRGVRYLRRLGYNIIITTSQKEETLEPTINWLKKHKFKFDKMFNTKNKHLVEEYDIHVDDDPEQITNITNANKKVIIFTSDQNKKSVRKEIEERCVRVRNWNELIDLFEDISKVNAHVKNFVSFPQRKI